MDSEIVAMQVKIEALTEENRELKAWKQKFSSQKQSLDRMSTRLRKLCKRLEPTTETTVAMQQLADEIRSFVKQIIYGE